MNVDKDILNILAETSDLKKKRDIIASLAEQKTEQSLDSLITILEYDSKIQTKSFATDAIIKIITKKSTRKIMRLLKSNSWVTRMKAVEILGELNDKKAIFQLIRILNNDNESSVREWAAIALGKIKDRKAIRSLIKSLKSDSNWEVRMESAIALGKIKDKKAKKALIESFYSDCHYKVNWAAAAALAKFKDPQTKKILQELSHELSKLLKTEKDEGILSAAAKTLGEIGKEQEAKTLINTMKVSKELVKLEISVALERMAKRLDYKNQDELIKKVQIQNKKVSI